MGDLLTLAKEGDDAALFRVLSINSLLVYHPGTTRRIQQATATREHDFVRKMLRAIAHRPNGHKNSKSGFIMTFLWEVRLKYLHYNQIACFLEVVEVTPRPYVSTMAPNSSPSAS